MVPSFKVFVSRSRLTSDGDEITSIPGGALGTKMPGSQVNYAEWSHTFTPVSARFLVRTLFRALFFCRKKFQW